MTKTQKKHEEPTRTTINLRHIDIVSKEIYISGAQNWKISQIWLLLNQHKIINNIS